MQRALRWRRVLTGLSLLGCHADVATAPPDSSHVAVEAKALASTAGLTVEVSGPGIDPGLLFNIAVGHDGTARDTLTVPSGGGRRFVVTAVDTLGVATHRADTTVTLAPGPHPGIALVLRPLNTTVGVTITFQMRQ